MLVSDKRSTSIFQMGKKVSIFGGLAFMLIVNASKGSKLAPDCANDNDKCVPHQQNPCCFENFKCKWLDSAYQYQCIEKAKLGDYCVSNDDCSDILHSICSPEGKCVCRLNNVQSNITNCAPLLNEFCWKESCAPENSICVDNECECKSGYLAKSNDRCLPMLLGSPCEDDTTCKSVNFAKCSSHKICICPKNTIEISPIFCSLLLEEYCRSGDECGIRNSECIGNKCQCKHQYISYSNTECKVSYLEMPCGSSSDCENDIRALECIDNTCKCIGHYGLGEKKACLSPINYKCWRNSDCESINTACIANICQCKPNYLLKNSKCLPRYLDGPCQLNNDCSNIKSAVCLENKCVCDDGFFSRNRTACARGLKDLGGICAANKDCFIKYSYCFQDRCECVKGYIQTSHDKCLTTELQGFCYNNDDCKIILNARCSRVNQCICREKYVKKNNMTCAPLLTKTSSASHCTTDYSIIDGSCQSNDDHVAQSDTKSVDQYFEKSCVADEHCINISNAKCSNVNKCICHSNYVKLGRFTCAPLLGGYCKQNEDCITENSKCFRNQCVCSKRYFQHDSYDLCVPVSLGQTCLDDEDCSEIRNGKCSEDNVCECEPNYSKFDQLICLPLIGGHCEEHKECLAYNSNCLNETCHCLENYIPQSNTKCLSKLLSTACYNNIDCQYIMNSHCSPSNRCVCNLNSIINENGMCVPILGAHCSTNYSCIIPNSECIDQNCQCKPNFARGDYNDCLTTNLEQFCDRNYDCAKIRHSKCVENKCVCRNKYMALDKTACRPLLHGVCSSNNDCLVENSVCVRKKCQCNVIHMEKVPNKCVPILLGKICQSDISCRLIQKAVCSSNKICVCDLNTFALDAMTCAPLLNTSCRRDECKIESSQCIERKCQCKPGYSAVSANQCVKTSSLYSCWNSSHCAEPWHFDCSEEKKCVCKANNLAVNISSCLPMLGGYCWKHDQCVTQNSVCVDFHCRCNSGFMPVSHNMCRPSL